MNIKRLGKRVFSTLLVSSFIVLCTSVYAVANSLIAADTGNFPYFQLGSLVMAGLIIASLHQRFKKIYISESIGAFALYAILITLFTEPVFNAIKSII